MFPIAEVVYQKPVYLLPLANLDKYPTVSNFSCFIAREEDTTISSEAIHHLADGLLAQGLKFVVAWGADCTLMECVLDEAIIEWEKKHGETDSVIVTTSHPRETLPEALEFLFNSGLADESAAVLVIYDGPPATFERLDGLLKKLAVDATTD